MLSQQYDLSLFLIMQHCSNTNYSSNLDLKTRAINQGHFFSIWYNFDDVQGWYAWNPEGKR